MYFPYLYGRQAELFALRDIANAYGGSLALQPIVEPYISDPRTLLSVSETMVRQGLHAFIVVNPRHGEFAGDVSVDRWRDALNESVITHPSFSPAFQVLSELDLDALTTFLGEHPDREKAVIVRGAAVSPDQLRARVTDSSTMFFIHRSANPRAFLSALPHSRTVEVEQSFSEQPRNADYEGAEWFTSSNLDFQGAGRPGFSDFGPLGPVPNPGGGQIGAAAIHLAFRYQDGSIWLQHFISDSTARGDGTQTTKMAEATAKIHAAVMQDPLLFISNPGLRQFLEQHDAGRPTSLPTSKQQQLVHHMVTATQCIPEEN